MLDFVICGPEHSGTTLVSDLFRQIPGLDAGFEVGVLLADTPRHFPTLHPFYERMTPGWGVPADDLPACCDTDSFAEFYTRIAAASLMIKRKTTRIFDKTPRYLLDLTACMNRTSVPFIVTYKDPRAIVFSDYLRSGESDFDSWFDTYAEPKHGYLSNMYREFIRLPHDGRAKTMSLERLCLSAGDACDELFAHCGHAFTPEYLILDDLRFHNTRSNSISPRLAFEYLKGMTSSQLRTTRDCFQAFEAWFYD